VEIREARTDEAESLAAVQELASVAALGHIFPPERYPYPREAIRARWTGALADPSKRVLIAVTGDEPVGAALVSEEWLEGLYVVPEQWGSGLGGSLHDQALELVRELGSTRCRLWVLEENVRARRFYERRGWRENGETRVVDYPPNPLDVGYSLDF
jgi:GNAT superfamily N-acetyltransferase